MKPFLKFWRHSSYFLAQLAIISLVLEQFIFISAATAQTLPITPDGSTNTQIDAAANGVPIVNIAAPNSGGMSHNRFTDYNVNQQGLILNNSAGDANGVVQTQIGGLITGNENMVGVAGGGAAIILNEVTSNHISRINGYTEIAGRKADLIIANPNGVSFAGAGFINTSHLTVVVGSANQFNPNPSDLTFALSGNAYQVTNGFLPQLTISGAGIDLESVASTDFVANLMNIVAPIYGADNEVNLRAGDNQFNYLTKNVTSNSDSTPAQLAIDASSLAQIQAGKVFIIATKEGFGVRYTGDMLASRGGIKIDSLGNVSYNNIVSSAGNIEINSRQGSISGSGVLQTSTTSDNIILTATTNLINSGQLVGSRDITLTAGAEFNNSGEIITVNNRDLNIIAGSTLINSGSLLSNRNLNLNATSIINSNQIIAAQNLGLTSSILNNSSQIIANENLTINSAQITNSDSILAGNKITITATDFLTNNQDIISAGDIDISAKTLNNNKQIAAQNDVTINSDIINNNVANNSLILALRDINFNVINLDNSAGNIQSGRNLTLKIYL